MDKRLSNIKRRSGAAQYVEHIKCPECIFGDGWITLVPGDIGYDPLHPTARECKTCSKRREKERRDRLQKISRLTDEEKEFRMSDIYLRRDRPDTTKMVNAVNRFIKNPRGILTIYGTNGNGKSVALIAAINELIDSGKSALYITALDLLMWIQESYNKDTSKKEGTALDKVTMLKEIEILAIDEFGAAKASDWRTEILETIIDFRWRQGLDNKQGTLIATNEDPEQHESYRIRSRLMDARNTDTGIPIIINKDSDVRPSMRRKQI